MTSTKSKKKTSKKPIKEKELKKGGDIKEREVAGGRNKFVYIRELEAISNLAVNVRKLAKFQKQDSTNKNYPRGVKNKQAELFNIYDQLLNLLTSECETFLTQTAKETINGKKDR